MRIYDIIINHIILKSHGRTKWRIKFARAVDTTSLETTTHAHVRRRFENRFSDNVSDK